MTLDLQDGCFDESLVKYGIKANLKLVTSSDGLPPKPKVGTLEIWQLYLEYKKPSLKSSTFYDEYENRYCSAIKQAIESVGDNAIDVRNWLIANRCLQKARCILSALSSAYRLAIRKQLVEYDPFDGMAQELFKVKSQKVNTYEEDDTDEKDLYEPDIVKKKAFTLDEVEAILDYVKKSRGSHYYPILKFLFLTGCRTGEAIGFMWGDIKWDREFIVIQRSYHLPTKSFVSTKTGSIRLFRMSKNGDLWNLLKSLNPGKPNEVVFKAKRGGVVNRITLGNFWRGVEKEKNSLPGVIPRLIKQGKVTKYLPLYNTRHTFISYQINECGVPPYVVKDWCGHSEDMTARVYRQEDLLTKPVDYADKTLMIDTSETAKIQALEQQNLMQAEQIKALQEIVASLQKTTQQPPE
jgi:integrase